MNNAASLFPALATPSASASPSLSTLGSGLSCLGQPDAEASGSFGSMLADALPAQQPVTNDAVPVSALSCRPSSAANPRALAQELFPGDVTGETDSRKAALPNWGRSIEVLTTKVAEQQNPGWAPQGLMRRLPELFSPLAAPVPDSSLDALCALPSVPASAPALETELALDTVIVAEEDVELSGSDDTPASSEEEAPVVAPVDLSSHEESEVPAPTTSQPLRPGASPGRPLPLHAAAGIARAVAHLEANSSAALGRAHPARHSQEEPAPLDITGLAEESIEEVDTATVAFQGLSSAVPSPVPVVLPSEVSCAPIIAANTAQTPASLSTAQEAPPDDTVGAESVPSSGAYSGTALPTAASAPSGQPQPKAGHRVHESGKRPAVPSLTPNKPDFAASGSFLPSLERPASAQADGSLPLAGDEVGAAVDSSVQQSANGSRRVSTDLGTGPGRAERGQLKAASDSIVQDGGRAAVGLSGIQLPDNRSAEPGEFSDTPVAASPGRSPKPMEQGGVAERSALNPASHERQGIPFGREQNLGNAVTGQATEPSATQAQALTHAAARSIVMRSYGVPALASAKEFPSENLDSDSSAQSPMPDLSVPSAPLSAAAVSSGSGSSSRGSSEERSALADGRSRQDGEKSAVQGIEQRSTESFARVASKEKNVQAIGGKIEAKSEKMAGIDDAKKGANMNSVPSSQATPDVLPASRSTMDWVAEGLSRLGSGDTSASALAQSELAPHAKQLVERVEKALESLQSRPERVVRFDVGDSRDERLSVSLQLKDGVIHTTFASGSTELRDLISREWSGSLGSALSPEAHLRVAEPVFTASSRNENLDTGSQSQRQQQQPSQQGHAAGQQGQGFQRASSRAASSAAPEAPVQTLPTTPSSHRVLQAFA